MAEKKYTGAEILWKSLEHEKAKLLFGIPGGVVLPFYDAIHKNKKIKHVLPRHEQGGGFAADGYARASGDVGLALGTSGPGATNLLTSISNSRMDSVPVIYLTGQVLEEVVGTDAFQEIDILGMSIPVVKHSYLVTKAADIQRVIKEAFYIAKEGRPGPIHIDFLKDVWGQKTLFKKDPKMQIPGCHIKPKLSSDLDILRLNRYFERNDLRPVVIAGHGVEISKAQKELLAFVKKHELPVVNTLLGLGNFPQGDQHFCGMVGMHGDAVANYVVDRANLIIGIGCRFDDRITGSLKSFIKGKEFVHMDIDLSEISKNIPCHLAIVGDSKETLTKANCLLDKHNYPGWWEQIKSLKEKYGFLNFTGPQSKKNLLSQAELIHEISEATEGRAIVTSDVGRHQMWVARFYRFKHPNSHLSSGGLGSMGYSISAAIGAKLAKPQREVWSISGDGGFKMNMQELGTIAEYNIDVKLVIMEDNAFGMVYQWQNLLFKGNVQESRFQNPDFCLIAKAFGIRTFKATTMLEAKKAIQSARRVKGPVLIVFKVNPNEHVYPMVVPKKSLGEQILYEY